MHRNWWSLVRYTGKLVIYHHLSFNTIINAFEMLVIHPKRNFWIIVSFHSSLEISGLTKTFISSLLLNVNWPSCILICCFNILHFLHLSNITTINMSHLHYVIRSAKLLIELLYIMLKAFSIHAHLCHLSGPLFSSFCDILFLLGSLLQYQMAKVLLY